MMQSHTLYIAVTTEQKIAISAAVVVSLILIISMATVGALIVRRCRRPHKHRHAVWELAMGSIAVTDDILMEFRRRNSLKKESIGPTVVVDEDPLEFPRNRLILLDRVLGKTLK